MLPFWIRRRPLLIQHPLLTQIQAVAMVKAKAKAKEAEMKEITEKDPRNSDENDRGID